MTTVLYVLLAVFIFGVLIFIHEGGHYLFARLFKVAVKEFAIGMGPKIVSRASKKTGIVYSLRALPIGGFVSMVGEDEESDDPNALNKKPVWQRIIIVAAGALTNIIVGMLVMSVLVCSSPVLGSTTVAQVNPDTASYEAGLRQGDRITRINNVKVHISDELVYEIMRLGIKPVDITLERNGETVVLEDVQLPVSSDNGYAFGNTDFLVYREDINASTLIKHSFFRSSYTVRMIWESLYDLVTGRYSIEAVSGPVGVTQALTEAAETGSYNFIYLVVVISMNLGVVNLLPLPALDGGRLVFLIAEGIRRKPVKPEIEGYVHFAGLVLLMLFMVVICVKDVIGLLG